MWWIPRSCFDFDDIILYLGRERAVLVVLVNRLVIEIDILVGHPGVGTRGVVADFTDFPVKFPPAVVVRAIFLVESAYSVL